MIKKGDLVTRKKYNNDILFRVEKIENNNVILSGAEIRLYADSSIDDLVVHTISKKENKNYIRNNSNLTKESFYIPGSILHIDEENKKNNTLKTLVK